MRLPGLLLSRTFLVVVYYSKLVRGQRGAIMAKHKKKVKAV
jgi:hypothetical protein